MEAHPLCMCGDRWQARDFICWAPFLFGTSTINTRPKFAGDTSWLWWAPVVSVGVDIGWVAGRLETVRKGGKRRG
jgi:hypothetical protein